MRGANNCYLSGQLSIQAIHQVPLNGHTELVVHGWVQPKVHDPQETHPVLLTGKHAQLILDLARQHPHLKPHVVIEGCLFTQADRTVVHVRFVDILNAFA